MSEEIKKAADTMEGMTHAARLVAHGVARRDYTPEKQALEIAIETLKFIAKMVITINGVETTEPVSRLEARVGLAKIYRALGHTPPAENLPGTTAAPEV